MTTRCRLDRWKLAALCSAAALLAASACQSDLRPSWTPAELEMLRSLWLGSLPPLSADPSNAVADDLRAAQLGQRLFFDQRLSGNGAVACASCHQPEHRFTDGLPRSRAIGETRRNAPSLIGAAYSPWLYWDGRKDSLWSQALSPLEDAKEHGGNRLQYARLVADDAAYGAAYEALFGPLPDLSDTERFPAAAGPVAKEGVTAAWQAMTPQDRDAITEVFVNLGKAIAAFERQLLPGASRFDTYVQALLAGNHATARATLSVKEVRGLRLFMGDAQCARCHNGPLLTNNEFHNTGIISAPGHIPDKGRIDGVREALVDPFNCLGVHSDDPAPDCAELRFVRTDDELLGALRTPSLRNLAGTDPYMHAGQLATLAEVLKHYNEAPLAMIGHNEAEPLNLSRRQLGDLEAFLLSLDAPPATAPEWLGPPRAAQSMQPRQHLRPAQ